MFWEQCWSLPCGSPSRLCVTLISRQRFPVSIGVNIVGGDVGRSWFCILGNILADLGSCDWTWVCGWHPNGPGSPWFLITFVCVCFLIAPFALCCRLLGTFCFATWSLSCFFALVFLCYCFPSPRCPDCDRCSFPFTFWWWFLPIPITIITFLIFPNFACNSFADLGLSSPGLGLLRKIWRLCRSDIFLYFCNKAWLIGVWIFVVWLCFVCVHCLGFFHGRADILSIWTALKFWSCDISSSSRFNCWLSIRNSIRKII